MKDLNEIKVHGKRVILHYKTYSRVRLVAWEESGSKWEECRWIEDPDMLGGSKPHFEPWGGNERTRVCSSYQIEDKDIIDWIEVP